MMMQPHRISRQTITSIPKQDFKGNETFAFRPRAGKLNIRLLHSVDPEQVMVDGDLDTVHVHMENLAFSKICKEDLRMFNDEFLLKILQLCQLTMEYLFSRAHDDRTLSQQLAEENQELQQQMIAVESKVAVQKSQIIHLQKENKAKTKQLQTYEAMLSTGRQSGVTVATGGRQFPAITAHRCSECGKSFSSVAYLNSHVQRRHSYAATADDYNNNNNKPDGYSDEKSMFAVKESGLQQASVAASVKQLLSSKEQRLREADLRATTAGAPGSGIQNAASPLVVEDVVDKDGRGTDHSKRPGSKSPRQETEKPHVRAWGEIERLSVVEESPLRRPSAPPEDERLVHTQEMETMLKQVSTLRTDLETQLNVMRKEMMSSLMTDIKIPLENKVELLAKCNEESIAKVRQSVTQQLPTLQEQVQDLKEIMEWNNRKIRQKDKSKAGELVSDTDSDTVPEPQLTVSKNAGIIAEDAVLLKNVEAAVRSSQESLLGQISYLQQQSKVHNLRVEELLNRERSVAKGGSLQQEGKQKGQQQEGGLMVKKNTVSSLSVTPRSSFNEATKEKEEEARARARDEGTEQDKTSKTSKVQSTEGTPRKPSKTTSQDSLTQRDRKEASKDSASLQVDTAEDTVEDFVQPLSPMSPDTLPPLAGAHFPHLPTEEEPEVVEVDDVVSIASGSDDGASVTESMVETAKTEFAKAKESKEWLEQGHEFMGDSEKALFMISMNNEGVLSKRLSQKAVGSTTAPKVLTEEEIHPWDFPSAQVRERVLDNKNEEDVASSLAFDSLLESDENDDNIHGERMTPALAGSGSVVEKENEEEMTIEQPHTRNVDLGDTVEKAFWSSWNFISNKCREERRVDARVPSKQSSGYGVPDDDIQCTVNYEDRSTVVFQVMENDGNSRARGLGDKSLRRIETGRQEMTVDSFLVDEYNFILKDYPACPTGRAISRDDFGRVLRKLQQMADITNVPLLGGNGATAPARPSSMSRHGSKTPPSGMFDAGSRTPSGMPPASNPDLPSPRSVKTIPPTMTSSSINNNNNATLTSNKNNINNSANMSSSSQFFNDILAERGGERDDRNNVTEGGGAGGVASSSLFSALTTPPSEPTQSMNSNTMDRAGVQSFTIGATTADSINRRVELATTSLGSVGLSGDASKSALSVSVSRETPAFGSISDSADVDDVLRSNEGEGKQVAEKTILDQIEGPVSPMSDWDLSDGVQTFRISDLSSPIHYGADSKKQITSASKFPLLGENQGEGQGQSQGGGEKSGMSWAKLGATKATEESATKETGGTYDVLKMSSDTINLRSFDDESPSHGAPVSSFSRPPAADETTGGFKRPPTNNDSSAWELLDDLEDLE